MNDIKHEAYINEIFVTNTDLHKNVINKVTWSVVFNRGDHTSVAGGESTIKFTQLKNFIEIDDLDANTVLDWAFSSHGVTRENFLSHLKAIHTPVIEKLERESKLTVWDGMLKNQMMMVESIPINTNDIFDVLK
jgi:hypothetical protein